MMKVMKNLNLKQTVIVTKDKIKAHKKFAYQVELLMIHKRLVHIFQLHNLNNLFINQNLFCRAVYH